MTANSSVFEATRLPEALSNLAHKHLKKTEAGPAKVVKRVTILHKEAPTTPKRPGDTLNKPLRMRYLAEVRRPRRHRAHVFKRGGPRG